MGIDVKAIIINLDSGKYLLFEEEASSLERKGFSTADFITEERVVIFSFNKQAFLQSPTDKSISRRQMPQNFFPSKGLIL